MHLSIRFCGYAFFDKIFLSLSNSWWNFKKSEDKLKQRFNKLCTKPKLYLSGIKLMKLVYTPLNVSFLKTLVTNLSFSWSIFTSRKDSENLKGQWKFHVLMVFIYIFKKKLCMFWFIKQSKNIIHISFVINRFEILQAIFQTITFVITKKNTSQCQS